MRFSKFLLTTAMAGAALTAAAPAWADDSSSQPVPFKHWIVRLRAISVLPQDSSNQIQPLSGVLGADARTSVGNSYTPELDFTYMATPNIGAELILGTTRNGINGSRALAPLGSLAHTWVLPPTLTLQYHFAPESHIRPYVGAGINYTIFYASKPTDTLNDALGAYTKVGLSDSVGYALQAGVDIDITPKVFLNFDLKYLDINTTAYLNTGGWINSERVHVNPLVPGIGIGTRF